MDDAEAKAIMSHHARSFAPAARLLPAKDWARVARLYALCRIVDDLADEDGGPEAIARLGRMETELFNADTTDPVAREARELFDGRAEGLDAFSHLVWGVRLDLEPVLIADEPELMNYCQAVAGTVGIMVCALFDVPPAYHRQASALGRAMQLTNICRDVLEDAERGRRYLPETICPLAPVKIAGASADTRVMVRAATTELLEKAEALYAEGAGGYHALPFRLRLAVVMAAVLYRGIGRELRARGADPLAGRVRLRKSRKVRLALTGLPQVLAPSQPGASRTGAHA